MQYFPQPDVFDPERFSPENRKNIKPYTYMPFGAGPHGCIGPRLGFLQIKIGLFNFLRNHIVLTCPKTLIPMKFDPKAIVTAALGGIHVNVMQKSL